MSKAAVLARIQRCFRAEEYEVSFHALEELAADGLSPEDLDCVILHGTIARRLTEDPRGVPYEVCGTSLVARWTEGMRGMPFRSWFPACHNSLRR